MPTLVALYILQYAKGTSQDEAMSNSEKIQPTCLKALVSQSVSWSVSQLVENFTK